MRRPGHFPRRPRALTKVDLIVEVAGCPTVCRHCWALGTPYGPLALTDADWVLSSVHYWCDSNGVRFGAFPMHEVAAHPQAAALIRLFAEHDWVSRPFQPFTTTGVPLALRDDWREVLAAAAQTGTTIAWLAFHGVGGKHDRVAGRRGAFQESCLAVERIHDAGLQVGANIFLTSANAAQVPELAATMTRLKVEQECWLTAAFYPSPRSRRYEALRAHACHLSPFAAEILDRSLFYKQLWADLESWTEGAWVQRALSGGWPELPAADEEEVHLVCRPNLDIHFGRAGLHGERFGNLRSDGVDSTMARALEARGRPLDRIWFPADVAMPLPDLALSFGLSGGGGLHTDGESVRYLWLDRMRPQVAARAARPRQR